MTDVTAMNGAGLTKALSRVFPFEPDALADLVRQFFSSGGSADINEDCAVLTDASGRRTTVRVGASAVTSSQLVSSLPELDLDPVPHAAVANALRIRAAHAKLLSSGAYDYTALAEGREATVESTRQFVSRAQRRGEVFTVEHRGATWVPALLLNDELDVRAEFAPIIATFKETGTSGWALWNWLVSPNGWLDGSTPVDVLGSDPEAALEAARARLERAA